LDVPTFDTVDALRWTGPCTDFEDCCRRLQSPDLFKALDIPFGQRSLIDQQMNGSIKSAHADASDASICP
jgi:hypothetical protein